MGTRVFFHGTCINAIENNISHYPFSLVDETGSWPQYRLSVYMDVNRHSKHIQGKRWETGWAYRPKVRKIFEEIEKNHTEDTPTADLSTNERQALLMLQENQSHWHKYMNPTVDAMETKLLQEILEDMEEELDSGPLGLKLYDQQLHQLIPMAEHREADVRRLATDLRSKYEESFTGFTGKKGKRNRPKAKHRETGTSGSDTLRELCERPNPDAKMEVCGIHPESPQTG